jgi:hypothetical protein
MLHRFQQGNPSNSIALSEQSGGTSFKPNGNPFKKLLLLIILGLIAFATIQMLSKEKSGGKDFIIVKDGEPDLAP